MIEAGDNSLVYKVLSYLSNGLEYTFLSKSILNSLIYFCLEVIPPLLLSLDKSTLSSISYIEFYWFYISFFDSFRLSGLLTIFRAYMISGDKI